MSTKGISSAVAVTLVIIVTIALLYLLANWIFGVTGKTMRESGERITTQAEQMYCLRIDQVAKNRVYLRNCGPGVVRNGTLNIFIDGKPVDYSLSRDIPPNQVGYAELTNLYDFGVGDHDMTISAGSFVSQRFVKIKPSDSSVAFFEFDDNWTAVPVLDSQGNVGYRYYVYDTVNGIDARAVDGPCWSSSLDPLNYGSSYYIVYPYGCLDEIDPNLYPDWVSAKKFCEKAGGYLAVFSSWDELSSMPYWANGLWIGLYQDPNDLTYSDSVPRGSANEPAGDWKWLSVEPSSYFNWESGQPDNVDSAAERLIGVGFPPANCGLKNDNFTDADCTYGMGFICEYDQKPDRPELRYPWLPVIENGVMKFSGYDDIVSAGFFKTEAGPGGKTVITEDHDPPNRVSLFVRVKKTGYWWEGVRIAYRAAHSLNPAYGIEVYGDGTLAKACVYTSEYRCADGSINLNDGKFHLLGLTYDGSEISLYFDGNKIGSVPQTGPINYSKPVVDNGNTFYVNEFEFGQVPMVLDFVRVLSEAVDPKEMVSLE